MVKIWIQNFRARWASISSPVGSQLVWLHTPVFPVGLGSTSSAFQVQGASERRELSSCCKILAAAGDLLPSVTAWASVTANSSKHLQVRAETHWVCTSPSVAWKISGALCMERGFTRNLGIDVLLKILSVPLRDWLHNSDKCQAPFSAFSGLNASVQSQQFFLYFSFKLIVSSKKNQRKNILILAKILAKILAILAKNSCYQSKTILFYQ